MLYREKVTKYRKASRECGVRLPTPGEEVILLLFRDEFVFASTAKKGEKDVALLHVTSSHTRVFFWTRNYLAYKYRLRARLSGTHTAATARK